MKTLGRRSVGPARWGVLPAPRNHRSRTCLRKGADLQSARSAAVWRRPCFLLQVSTPWGSDARLCVNVTHDDDVAAAILGYLEEHPHGMDTLEGIAEWWVIRQQIRVEGATVTRVLQRLTERGTLEVIANGAHRLYRRKV